MSSILELIISFAIFLIFLVLFIITPLIASYYLYKRLWINDSLRLFFASTFFLSAVFIAIVMIFKLFAA